MDRSVDLNAVNSLSPGTKRRPKANSTRNIAELVLEDTVVRVGASEGNFICFTSSRTRGGKLPRPLRDPQCVFAPHTSLPTCEKGSKLYNAGNPPKIERPEKLLNSAVLFRYKFVVCGYHKQSELVSRSLWLTEAPRMPSLTMSSGRVPQGATVKIKTGGEKVLKIDSGAVGYTRVNEGSETVCFTVTSRQVPLGSHDKVKGTTPACAMIPFECAEGSLLYEEGSAIAITGVPPHVRLRDEPRDPTALTTHTTVRAIACSFGGESAVTEAHYRIIPPATWPTAHDVGGSSGSSKSSLVPSSSSSSSSNPSSSKSSKSSLDLDPLRHETWAGRRMKLSALAADDICYAVTLDAHTSKSEMMKQMQSVCLDDSMSHTSRCSQVSHNSHAINSASKSAEAAKKPWGWETWITFPLAPVRKDMPAHFTLWAVACSFGGNTKVWHRHYDFLVDPPLPKFHVHSDVYQGMTNPSTFGELPEGSDVIVDCSFGPNNADEKVIACIMDLSDIDTSLVPMLPASDLHYNLHPLCSRGKGIGGRLHCTNGAAAHLIGTTNYFVNRSSVTVFGRVTEKVTLGAVCCTDGAVTPSLSAKQSKLVQPVPLPVISAHIPMAVASFTALGEPSPPKFCVDRVKCNPPKTVPMDILQARLKIVTQTPRAIICFTVNPSKLVALPPTCTVRSVVSSNEKIMCGTGSHAYFVNDTISKRAGIDLRPHAIAVRSMDITVQAIACNWGGPSKVSEV